MIASPKTLIEEMVLIKNLRNAYKLRYKEIGVGRIVGLFLFLSFFTVLPWMLKKIWPFLFSHYSILTVYLTAMMVINLGVFIIYNFILYLVYKLKHPFFEQYKNTDKPWPWQENVEQWKKLRTKSTYIILLNFFVVLPIMLYLSTSSTLPFDFNYDTWPSTFEIFWQFIVFLLTQDFFFYSAHRLLHHPKLYWIHKFHHEHRQSIPIASPCMHPIEYLLAGTLPSTLGFQILSRLTRVHFSTMIIWLIFRLIHGYEVHCGYTWTWSIQSIFPYAIASDHHDFHHAMNAGNYGSIFLFWDALFQTEAPYIKYLTTQLENKEKEQKATEQPKKEN